MLPIVIKILLVIHVLVSLLIVLLVLMQRPKNEGLGAAFGGGMTDNLFGVQTTNVLQTITRWLGFLFFALTLLLSILYSRQGTARSRVQEKLSEKTVIPAPAKPVLPDGAAPLEGNPPVKLELGPDGAVVPAVPTPSPETPAPAPEVPKAPDSTPAPAEGSAPAPAPAAGEPKAADPVK